MPKVDRLGGKTWGKKKAAVKKAVKDMTEELVKLMYRYMAIASYEDRFVIPASHREYANSMLASLEPGGGCPLSGGGCSLSGQKSGQQEPKLVQITFKGKKK